MEDFINNKGLDMSEEIKEEVKELTPEELAAEKAKILEEVKNPKKNDDGEEPKLPSEEGGEPEEKVYANTFKSVEELRKGIDNLESTLPQYVLDGMSDEALEQHYVELRKEFSSKGQEKKEDTKVEKPDANISDDLWSGLEAQYAETGSITDEQRAELNKSGIPDKMIDGYIDGLKAQAKADKIELEQFTAKVYDIAGGEEEYNTIKAWAEETYSQEELDAIATGSYEEILFKMKGIKADYIAKNGGITADRLRGGTGSKSGEQYKSQADYLVDRMDPRYKRDAKYKHKVDSKFANSAFAS